MGWTSAGRLQRSSERQDKPKKLWHRFKLRGQEGQLKTGQVNGRGAGYSLKNVLNLD